MNMALLARDVGDCGVVVAAGVDGCDGDVGHGSSDVRVCRGDGGFKHHESIFHQHIEFDQTRLLYHHLESVDSIFRDHGCPHWGPTRKSSFRWPRRASDSWQPTNFQVRCVDGPTARKKTQNGLLVYCFHAAQRTLLQQLAPSEPTIQTRVAATKMQLTCQNRFSIENRIWSDNWD